MSFKEYDKKTFLIDAANDFTARRISKRSFLKKTAMAGVATCVALAAAESLAAGHDDKVAYEPSIGNPEGA